MVPHGQQSWRLATACTARERAPGSNAGLCARRRNSGERGHQAAPDSSPTAQGLCARETRADGGGTTVMLGHIPQPGPGWHRELEADPDQNSRFLERLWKLLLNHLLRG